MQYYHMQLKNKKLIYKHLSIHSFNKDTKVLLQLHFSAFLPEGRRVSSANIIFF